MPETTTIRLAPWLKPILSLIVHDWLAITIGHTIYAARPLNDAELAHELVHVAQWERYGWTFPLRYAWASLTALPHPYRDNRYEIEARGDAGNVLPLQGTNPDGTGSDRTQE